MHKRILVGVIAAACFTPAAQTQTITPVATGLNSPRGLAFGPGGSLYVAEAGLGAGDGHGGPGNGAGFTGSVTEINGPGSAHPTARRILTGLASVAEGEEVLGPHGISVPGNGEIYVLIGESSFIFPESERGTTLAKQFGRLLRATQSGQWSATADIGGFSFRWTGDNKNAPFAPEGQFPDSNPYAVLALPGLQYVVDAGANTVNEVRGDGSIRIIAFVPNPQLPAVPGGPPAITISDAVPTCVAQGRDGRLYVGTLAFGSNFARFDPASPPFWASLPPQSKVYRIDPHSSNIFLTEADVWASGLNPITGCGFGRDGFYVTEFITQDSGYDGSGDVVRISVNPDGTAGARTALGVGALTTPNGFAAGVDGAIYVSNFSISAGIGQVVRVNH